ncbi:glutamate receptor 2.6-like isoform X2 [Momordica charantia]|uniref:Glutamate receptor 2.6-like isoform X2 n=1 Tax=Momordica charantia TaxID=3673 RepID=A0A6J1CSI0_MOMCH|nr:glutamate receptor 2.6-like isoform X2 [Momordica charantia]
MIFGAALSFFCLVGFLLQLEGSTSSEAHFRCSAAGADHRKNRVVKMGVIADNSSRLGREQIVAIHMALQNYPSFNSCHKLQLLLLDSPDNSAHATATALDLITHKKVEAMFGTLTREEVSTIYELHKPSMNIPIISLSTASLVQPSTIMPIQTSSFIQMANDITHQTRCIAAVVGQFRWRRVTALYENKNGGDFTTNMAILKLLSDSLRDFNSEIENHHDFSLSDPEPLIEEKLMNLSRNTNRVFILVQSSVELATLLFTKAKKLNMMENGYVWIVGDDMANLLDSLDSAAFSDLQGVIGCKIYFEETKNRLFKKFKTKFRRNYMSKFSEDEGRGDPSIFALRAYDACTAVASALDELQGRPSGQQWPQKVLESKFEGVSGVVSFKKGILSQLPTFQIINVFGKGYKEIAFWSPELGFFDKFSQQTSTNARTGNASFNFSSLVFWPGNARSVPKGWDFSNLKKPLRIGVSTKAAFQEFVRVNYNHTNGPHFSGFSISVFQKVAANLPYFLPYKFLPYNDSYDSLLQKVHNKEFDMAVGDFGIFADRFEYVDFSEPYLDNAAVMIVKEKPLKWAQSMLFMRAFTPQMWLLMLSMHIFVSSAIWLIERKHNDALKGFGNMLWFSVSVIFYLHREPIKSGLARFVLGPWLFTILIVTASFTASLSSMMTISRYQPSFLDIETLKLKNATVGCNNGSVMVRFLSQVLSFPVGNIKQISGVDRFPEALEKEEIQAAFFSGPHAEVFLTKHCKYYTRATIFKLVGMGFFRLFQKGLR